ncbi:MAG: hypothetical protein PHD41_07960 [Methanosarcinaceae archaeon]|nr:hypothetical protein [Methanosarcinaceae archaeon]MDD4331548.1 hypothetical protein [Methanosarcinaceae archaeon]MDD4748835.1 hypothetical protein [Methanosarcinaceae archaeon]
MQKFSLEDLTKRIFCVFWACTTGKEKEEQFVFLRTYSKNVTNANIVEKQKALLRLSLKKRGSEISYVTLIYFNLIF